jgi:hypothetical protein
MIKTEISHLIMPTKEKKSSPHVKDMETYEMHYDSPSAREKKEPRSVREG